MSDTPETDALMSDVEYQSVAELQPVIDLTEHARSLERRLQEAHDMCDSYAEQLSAVQREVEEMREALREEPGKWGWDIVLLVGRRVLAEIYPADIFTGASGDLGPTYIVALRNALSAIEHAALAEKGKP